MANDKMRTGPRGSSKQAAKIGVEIIQIPFNGAQSSTFVIPLPFDTTMAVVDCEAFAMTDTTVKNDDDSVLRLGRTGDTDAFATWDHGAATAGDFFTKTPGAEADEPFKAANLIDADTDLIATHTESSGVSGSNSGQFAIRVVFEAVSGGLFND